MRSSVCGQPRKRHGGRSDAAGHELSHVAAAARTNPCFDKENKLLLKDLTYTVKTAGEDASAPTVSAARDVFQKVMDEKLGDLDMTAVVRLF